QAFSRCMIGMRMHVANVSNLRWEAIDTKIRELAARKGEIDAEIGRWLLEARQEKVHERHGWASVYEYAERMLGYEPRLTREKLRVAEALERLHKLRALLESGQRSWSVVREITCVASAKGVDRWR